jgi:tetratricopeptide (TPR) repeat protein
MEKQVNLCATIQIDLARLKLFTHRYSDLSEWEPTHLKSVESTYNEIHERLYKVLMGGQWLYPELLQGIMAALKEFPIRAVLESSHQDTTPIENRLQDFQTQLDSLNSLNLVNRLEKPRAIDALLELARHIQATVGLGAQEHSPLYETIAQLIVKINTGYRPAVPQLEIQQQLNQWARKTRELRTATATELLDELIDICPHLQPAREILLDLLQRMEHLLYVLLIFHLKNKPLGFIVPIEIKTDFAQSKSKPQFYVLGQSTEKKPSWLQTNKTFRMAIETARSHAVEMLMEQGYKPSSTEFDLRVGLPDLRMFQPALLLYEYKSIELPVTLACFCQYPEIKHVISLNPAIMLTGPISSEISKAIFLPNLLESLGGIHTLLVTPKHKIPFVSGKTVIRHGPTAYSSILNDYLEQFNELLLQHPKVLAFGTREKWNSVLIQANKQQDPIIPTIERHKTALLDFIDQHQAIQLHGMTGIGKTFLVAQWLEKPEVQNRYGLILYTSVPEPSVSAPEIKQEIVSKWARKAFETLSRQLNHRQFERLELKCRNDPGLLDRATEFVEALRETLADTPVMWIIDNGQALQYPVPHHDAHEEQFTLEPRFAEIIQQVHTGEWQGCELLYITNQELAESSLPIYLLDNGFTFEEACQYLGKVDWPFHLHRLRDTVAQALGAHPKALELFAKDKNVSAAEIQDLLTSLPTATGEQEHRLTVCETILERIFTDLKNYHPKAWWMLMTASTFMGDFNREQFKHVANKVIPTGLRFDFRYDSTSVSKVLEDRRLLSWNEDQRFWNMHSLVRHYSQDVFLASHPKLYWKAHYFAGLAYFPLRNGQTLSDAHSKAKYANGENCAAALYHYDQAEYETGKQAVFQNYYEHPIAKARQFINNKQSSKAEPLLKKVLQGYAVEKQGDPLVVAVDKVSPDINYLVAKAIYFQRKKERYEIAALHYRQAMKQGKKEVAPLLISLLCEMVAGKPETEPLWEEAENLFNEVSQSVANNEDFPYEGLAEAYEKVALRYSFLNPDKAEMSLQVLEKAAKANIVWAQLYRLGAKLAKKTGQKKEVERWLRAGIEKTPKSADLYLTLGHLLKRQNKPDEAKQVYQTGIEKIPTSVDLYIALGRLLERQPDEAEQVYQMGIETNPTSADLYIALGRFLERLPDEAEQVYQIGIEKIPTSEKLYQALGHLLEQRNKPDEAKQVYQTGIETSPTNVDLYIALGSFLERQPDEAEQVYQTGIEKSPTSEKLYLALCHLLEQQNKPDAAKQVYQTGIEKISPTYELYFAYGRFLEQQNKPDEAKQVYQTGIEKVPPTFDLYFAYGRLLEQQNKPVEAEQVYQMGIDKIPACADLYRALGNLLEQQNKPVEAEKVYQTGIEKSPTNEHLYIALARILEQQNKPIEAEQVYRTGIEKVPATILYMALSCLLYRQNKLTEAENTCKIGIKKFPTMRLYLTLGYVLELQNKPQEAEDIYRMGIKNFPIANFPTAVYIYMALGCLLEEQNRLQLAKDTYKMGIEQVLTFKDTYNMGIEQALTYEVLPEALEQLERKGI